MNFYYLHLRGWTQKYKFPWMCAYWVRDSRTLFSMRFTSMIIAHYFEAGAYRRMFFYMLNFIISNNFILPKPKVFSHTCISFSIYIYMYIYFCICNTFFFLKWSSWFYFISTSNFFPNPASLHMSIIFSSNCITKYYLICLLLLSSNLFSYKFKVDTAFLHLNFYSSVHFDFFLPSVRNFLCNDDWIL